MSGLVSTQRLVLKVKMSTGHPLPPPFTVEDETGKPYCIVVPRTDDPFRVVIKDTDGNPIACAVETKGFQYGTGVLHGFRPLFAGQLPTSEKQDGMPLYAWAKIDLLGVAMANRNGYDKYDDYQASTNLLGSYGAPTHASVVKANLGCCLMNRSMVRVEASPGIYVREHVYDVTVAPGIDPVLMIGLAIFIAPGIAGQIGRDNHGG
jgi:hypothetical protein